MGESRQHAMDRYGAAAEYFYGHCLHIDPRFAGPPGEWEHRWRPHPMDTTQRAAVPACLPAAAE
ncbi:MAG: hypothetical protein P4L71_04650 [Acetobacteraceae bacterium]|nr:hypothetical protein [Acetobacteraceae bacterium]